MSQTTSLTFKSPTANSYQQTADSSSLLIVGSAFNPKRAYICGESREHRISVETGPRECEDRKIIDRGGVAKVFYIVFFYFVQSEIELHLSITRRPNFMQNFPLVSYIEVIIGFNFGVCCLYVFTSQR